MTSNVIDTEYLGEMSPIFSLQLTGGDDTFKLPAPIPLGGIELLSKLCGDKTYTEPLQVRVKVPKWYKKSSRGVLSRKKRKKACRKRMTNWLGLVDKYLDVPILKVFMDHVYGTDKWWEALVKVQGAYHFIKKFPWDFKAVHADSAAIAGKLDILKYMAKNKNMTELFTDITTVAGKVTANGHLETLKWISDPNKCFWSNVILQTACINRHLEIFQYFWELFEASMMTHHFILVAIGSDNIPVVKYLTLRMDDTSDLLKTSESITLKAAVCGNLVILKWLYEHDYAMGHSCGNALVNKGHLDVLKWYMDVTGRAVTDLLVCLAVEGGHVHILDYLWEISEETHSDTEVWDFLLLALDAAEEGHLNALEWIAEKSPLCLSENLVAQAAHNGHLEIVNWLITEKGITITTDEAADNAAFSGHFDILKFLRKNGAPWQYALEFATENGHLEIVKWILKNGELVVACNDQGIARQIDRVKKPFYVSDPVINSTLYTLVSTIQFSIIYGHFEILKYVYREYSCFLFDLCDKESLTKEFKSLVDDYQDENFIDFFSITK